MEAYEFLCEFAHPNGPGLNFLHAEHNDDAVSFQLSAEIELSLRVYKSLPDLLPQLVEQFTSGHVFPIYEGEYELESSISLTKFGFYKHALGALRNVLELGWLSVYWDLAGRSHIEIQGWLHSIEDTPFRKRVFAALKREPNIKAFDDAHKFLEGVEKLYYSLCDFAHTKGRRFSIRALSRSNVNTFNEASLRYWLKLLRQVVKTVVIFHILKYPIALRYTPLDDKFGFNPPMGGFFRPYQADECRKLFFPEELRTLQSISDADPGAVSIAEWVNSQPDITREEMEDQLERDDQFWISSSGFERWLETEESTLRFLKEHSPAEYEKRLQKIDRLREWARSNGHLGKS
jgi:hypothetical protein